MRRETMLSENPPEKLEAIDEENGNKKGENVREWICSSNTNHNDKILACGAIIVAELRMQEATWRKAWEFSYKPDLGVNSVGDLLQFSRRLSTRERYGVNTVYIVMDLARGVNGDEVEGRLLPKSHGSGKTFPGPQVLKTITSVECWLNNLCEELSERIQFDLDQNNRVAHTLTLNARVYKTNDSDSFKKFPSKSCPLRYGTAKIEENALKLFNSGLT
ncbi:hypothetical protein IFM89_009715 [Coptis chinensis]|uniref:DNA polymerase Y-family little finger domain-containing protein n=1 Tax=Coptis chinensis TaxID=261450 RepID=A0A835HDJ2_9MAGN|nr:hypothetical protein IFM89_009715 [Coptis chinensis]